LIESLVFWDSKRPITKKLLSRIDLRRLGCDEDQIASAASHEAERLGLTFDSDTVAGVLGETRRELVETLF